MGWLEKDPQTDIFPFQVPVQQILLLAKVDWTKNPLGFLYIETFILLNDLQDQTNQGLLALKLLNALVEEANSVGFFPIP